MNYVTQILLLYKVIVLLNQQCFERQDENFIGSFFLDNIDSQLEGFGYDVGSRESLWIPVVVVGWATYVEIAGRGSSAFYPSSEKFYQSPSGPGSLKSAMDKAAGNETALCSVE